jgi:hypothetical protein
MMDIYTKQSKGAKTSMGKGKGKMCMNRYTELSFNKTPNSKTSAGITGLSDGLDSPQDNTQGQLKFNDPRTDDQNINATFTSFPSKPSREPSASAQGAHVNTANIYFHHLNHPEVPSPVQSGTTNPMIRKEREIMEGKRHEKTHSIPDTFKILPKGKTFVTKSKPTYPSFSNNPTSSSSNSNRINNFNTIKSNNFNNTTNLTGIGMFAAQVQQNPAKQGNMIYKPNTLAYPSSNSAMGIQQFGLSSNKESKNSKGKRLQKSNKNIPASGNAMKKNNPHLISPQARISHAKCFSFDFNRISEIEVETSNTNTNTNTNTNSPITSLSHEKNESKTVEYEAMKTFDSHPNMNKGETVNILQSNLYQHQQQNTDCDNKKQQTKINKTQMKKELDGEGIDYDSFKREKEFERHYQKTETDISTVPNLQRLEQFKMQFENYRGKITMQDIEKIKENYIRFLKNVKNINPDDKTQNNGKRKRFTIRKTNGSRDDNTEDTDSKSKATKDKDKQKKSSISRTSGITTITQSNLASGQHTLESEPTLENINEDITTNKTPQHTRKPLSNTTTTTATTASTKTNTKKGTNEQYKRERTHQKMNSEGNITHQYLNTTNPQPNINTNTNTHLNNTQSNVCAEENNAVVAGAAAGEHGNANMRNSNLVHAVNQLNMNPNRNVGNVNIPTHFTRPFCDIQKPPLTAGDMGQYSPNHPNFNNNLFTKNRFQLHRFEGTANIDDYLIGKQIGNLSSFFLIFWFF